MKTTEGKTYKKLIDLLRQLSQPEGTTIQELVALLEISDNRVRKNINGLRDLGIEVIKDTPGRYRVKSGDVLSLFNMSTKELHIINELNEAIKKEQCIYLMDYLDSQGQTDNYRVRPIKLYDNNRRIWTYDNNLYDFRQFKISRIGHLKKSDMKIGNDHIRYPQVDHFGWAGIEEGKMVSFKMTHLAYLLLIETYPDTKPYTHQTGDLKYPYGYKAKVLDFRGVGRYLLGMPDQIKSIHPLALVEYLREKIAKSYFI